MLAGLSARESPPALPHPTEWEEMTTDYRQMNLSAGRHPLAFLRASLEKAGIASRKDLDSTPDGSIVKVCGLVTHLQHPQTAKGVVFASLEDEGGINNIIIWPKVFARYRYVLLQATLMVVTGKLQSQEQVINVIAEKIEDYSHWVKSLARNSRDFR
jgi:error-prone DNA polymerase